MGGEHLARPFAFGEGVLSSAVSRSSEAATPADASVPVLTCDGQRATLRLNRPKHVNRIEPDDLVALKKHVEAIEEDTTIRVLILTGTGRAFSSGYHLGDLGERIAAARPQEAAADGDEGSPFEQFTNQLENLRVPTICALNGPVYGGATDLALACDFRIGVAGMEMFMPAARLGLHYYPSGLRRYVSRLGLAAAKKLFLTAARIDADEMLRIGYLDQLVPPDELDGAVAMLADALAAQAPLAVAGMKRALNEIARSEFDERAARARHRASLASEDVKEGQAAFREKRKPRFIGR
jgi:enoyl-CoA hydratase/carnithine racemase